MAHIVMACLVMALYSYGLYSYGSRRLVVLVVDLVHKALDGAHALYHISRYDTILVIVIDESL